MGEAENMTGGDHFHDATSMGSNTLSFRAETRHLLKASIIEECVSV
jgi:hypothetical protein